MDSFFNVLVFGLVLTFILFFLRIILISWHNAKLARQLKHLANQAEVQQHAVATSAASNSTVQNTPEPPRDDLPPTYTEVMQSYINAKESIEANAVQTGMTTASSTVTIETNLSTTNLAPNAPNALPPTYESTIENGATTIVITEEQR